MQDRVPHPLCQLTAHIEVGPEGVAALRVGVGRHGAHHDPSVSSPEGVRGTDREGYCCLTGTWREGDVVALDFPMT